MLSESNSVSCAAVADVLPSVDDPKVLSLPARRHLEQCLRCQAEAVGYRRMRRLLASLTDYPPTGDVGLGTDISITANHATRRTFLSLPSRAATATIGTLAAAASVITIAARRSKIGRLADTAAPGVIVMRRVLAPVSILGMTMRRVLRTGAASRSTSPSVVGNRWSFKNAH